MDPGSKIVIAFLDSEMTRGTDGAVVYDRDTGEVAFKRLYQIEEPRLRDYITDLLTDEPQDGIVVETCQTELIVWLIPKRVLTTFVKTSAVLHNQTELPLWATMCSVARKCTLPT
jgi:hypothetical protein